MADTVESNLALMERYKNAWKTGDVDAAKAIFSPDLKGYQNGNSKVGGDFHGFDDWYKRWLEPLIEMTNGQIVSGDWYDEDYPETLVFAGDTLMVYSMYEKYERPDKGKLLTKRLVLYSIKDGHIVAFRFYDEDQAAYDAFFS